MRFTDNSVNTSALSRLMSSKFPLVIVLTEFAAQLRRLRLDLSLQWIPRNQNEEADALTNQDFVAFIPENRIGVDISELNFMVLDEMFAVADSLYADMRARREKAKSVDGPLTPGSGASRPAPLRERDPW